jgi:hypothetical protein
MKINTVRFNTYPNNKDHFKQIVYGKEKDSNTKNVL